MGGSNTEKSKDFAYRLYKKIIVNSIETRNIEIKLSKKIFLSNLSKIIPLIFEFETLWLEHKLKKNLLKKGTRYKGDLNRLKEIKKKNALI